MLIKYLLVFFISMLPLIEIRGAVPYALTMIDQGYELNLVLCCVIGVIGNMLPVPFIFFFAIIFLILLACGTSYAVNSGIITASMALS